MGDRPRRRFAEDQGDPEPRGRWRQRGEERREWHPQVEDRLGGEERPVFGRREEDMEALPEEGHRQGHRRKAREAFDSPAGPELHRRRKRHTHSGSRRSPLQTLPDDVSPPAARAKRRARKAREFESTSGHWESNEQQQSNGDGRWHHQPGHWEEENEEWPEAQQWQARVGNHRSQESRSRSRDKPREAPPLVLRPRSLSPQHSRDRKRSHEVEDKSHIERESGGNDPRGKKTREHGRKDASSEKGKLDEPVEKLGYGASKKMGGGKGIVDETKAAKSRKGAAAPLYGYGASKMLKDASGSSSDYTSDSSDSSDTEDKKVKTPAAAAALEGGRAKSPAPALDPSSPKKDASTNPQSPAAPASMASAKTSDESQSEQSDEEGSDASSHGEATTAAVDASEAGNNAQSWIANADGERLLAKKKKRKLSNSDIGLGGDHGTNGAAIDPDMEGGDGALAMDPYEDPYMATVDPYATVDDPYSLDISGPGDVSTASAKTSVSMPTAPKPEPAAARQPAETTGGGHSAKKEKKSKWRRKVSWQTPPRLDLPEYDDRDALTRDIKLSMNSVESKARRAAREEQHHLRNTEAASGGANAQAVDNVAGYIVKCTDLMNKLEAGANIETTVLAFWGRLNGAERARFREEFPEFMCYTS